MHQVQVGVLEHQQPPDAVAVRQVRGIVDADGRAVDGGDAAPDGGRHPTGRRTPDGGAGKVGRRPERPQARPGGEADEDGGDAVRRAREDVLRGQAERADALRALPLSHVQEEAGQRGEGVRSVQQEQGQQGEAEEEDGAEQGGQGRRAQPGPLHVPLDRRDGATLQRAVGRVQEAQQQGEEHGGAGRQGQGQGGEEIGQEDRPGRRVSRAVAPVALLPQLQPRHREGVRGAGGGGDGADRRRRAEEAQEGREARALREEEGGLRRGDRRDGER
mmetsp:Transcript_255/g.613  ORF Transcript_255/g.613 Transcript_255/m.613 type:complete len:274 (+) Transcript_255:260-1081(+)